MAYPFIVVEGIDGSGKNTQIENISDYIRKKRQKVTVIKFPTDSAKRVHDHLQKKKDVDQDELFSAFLEDIEKMQDDIKKSLRRGWVVADRYCISTAAYQSVDSDIEKRVEQVEKKSLLKPDYLFWLDVQPHIGAKRKKKQGVQSRFDEDLEFLKKVRENYLSLYNRGFMCSNWIRIDATVDAKRIGTQIIANIEGRHKAEEAY